ncbi:MAG: DUF4190 domain-containing protein [Clostridia bacterium]|nr:DUF4190 domain-containing protein [Clostridia bacterium]
MKFCGNCGQLVIQEELLDEPQTSAVTDQPAVPERPAESAPGGGQVPPQFGSVYGTTPRPGSAPEMPPAVSAPVGTAAWQMQNAAAQAEQAAAKKPDSFGIASMILGIVSIVIACCCCCIKFGFVFSLIAGITAIVLAIVAKSKSPEHKFSGMAIAGLIMGIIGTLLGVASMFLVMFSSVLQNSTSETAKDSDLYTKLKDFLESLGINIDESAADATPLPKKY